MKNEFRSLTKREKEILDLMLKSNFSGRDELLKQVVCSKVRTIEEYSDNWGSLEFLVQTDIKADVKERIPVQATAFDEDNVPIQIFLHVVNGKIDELEIVKADKSRIIKTIEANDLHIDKVRYEY